MRIVQVHGHWPVEEHILALYYLDAVQRVQRTENAEALINVMVGRQRAAGKMQTNFLLGPVLGNVKVKLPNSMIQISLNGLVKLEEKIGLENIWRRRLWVYPAWPSSTQRKITKFIFREDSQRSSKKTLAWSPLIRSFNWANCYDISLGDLMDMQELTSMNLFCRFCIFGGKMKHLKVWFNVRLCHTCLNFKSEYLVHFDFD